MKQVIEQLKAVIREVVMLSDSEASGHE